MVQLATPPNFSDLITTFDPATAPPATAQTDPLQTSLPLPNGPQGPQTTSDQYQHEGETLSNTVPAFSEHHATNAPETVLPPEKWEQTPPNVVTGGSNQDALYRDYTIALAGISMVQPTPDQIMRFLNAASMVNLRPIMSPAIWFSEEGLRLWYECVARIPSDASEKERDLLNIQRICESALQMTGNPDHLNLFSTVKQANQLLLSTYARRVANADKKIRDRENNRRAQEIFQLRKKHLGAEFKEEADAVEALHKEWKNAIKQRDELMKQWNNYIRMLRDKYEAAKDELHAKLYAKREEKKLQALQKQMEEFGQHSDE